jgi:hypothetical protein
MRVVKPLYGIAEAGVHWWNTYHKHHREKLHMQTSTFDPCLLISTGGKDDFAIVGMQTDDTLLLTTLRRKSKSTGRRSGVSRRRHYRQTSRWTSTAPN